MSNDGKSPATDKPRHPIQVVARRTGLSLDVIRAWERRYQVVTPHRSATKRRLYTDADIRKLSLLHRATRAGRRISDLAAMDENQILMLLSEDQSHQSTALTDTNGQLVDELPARHLDHCLAAVENLDPRELERALSDTSVDLSIPVLLEQVVSPLFKQIGKRWEQGRARVGHEHFASATVRSFLGHLLATANSSATGPVLLVSTPAGQNHEIGALMAAVIAASDGWRVTYLSPNIPMRDLAAIVKQQKPAAIVLGITFPVDDTRLPREFRDLKTHIPEEVQIIAGGDAVDGYRTVLDEIAATRVRDLTEFRHCLKRIAHKVVDPVKRRRKASAS